MSEPGDATTCGGGDAQALDARDELHEEPQRQEDQSRNLDETDEEAQEHESHDAGSWVQHEVGAEDPRDRSRGADRGYGRMRSSERLGEEGGVARKQVENHEASVAEAVLDVVAEDPEKQHVAEDVHPTSVEEHRDEATGERLGQQAEVETTTEVTGRFEG